MPCGSSSSTTRYSSNCLPFPLSKDTSCPPMPPIRGACCLKKHPGPLSGTRREAAPSYASPCRAAYVEQDARHRVQTIGLPTYGFAPILPHGIRRRRCLKALGTVRAARRSGLQPREAFQLHTASRLHPSKRIQHHQLVGGGRLVCPS